MNGQTTIKFNETSEKVIRPAKVPLRAVVVSCVNGRWYEINHPVGTHIGTLPFRYIRDYWLKCPEGYMTWGAIMYRQEGPDFSFGDDGENWYKEHMREYHDQQDVSDEFHGTFTVKNSMIATVREIHTEETDG